MWYIIAFAALLFVSILDGHLSSMVVMFIALVLGGMSIGLKKDKQERIQGNKVFGAIFAIYTLSSFISSRSFLNGQAFYVADSIKYITDYGDVNSWSWDLFFSTLSETYIGFADNNGLYNEGLSLWAYIGNHYLDGTTVFYLTFLQTLFGILASLEIYKIFLIYFGPRKAAKYTIIFAVLSLYHIYSIVIIRDIVLSYFYLLGLRRILSKPKVSDIFILLLVMLVTMGIRLYTGLFFGTFIMYWLYKLIQDTKYAHLKIIIVPLAFFGVAFLGATLAVSVIMEGAEGELEHYDELYAASSGLAGKLRTLPVGIRHIAILLFSQLPLDDLSRFSIANSFSNYYMSILVIVYSIFGFVIFYGLMYLCFFKGYFKIMSSDNKWVLIIMLLFIAITLSTHIDVRRSMEAIPFIYLFYILYYERINAKVWFSVNKFLIAFGFVIMFAYAFVR